MSPAPELWNVTTPPQPPPEPPNQDKERGRALGGMTSLAPLDDVTMEEDEV